MAPRKEKYNLRGGHVSPGGRILSESAKETPSKREASQLPVPEVEAAAHKVPKLDAESIHKGGSSTTTEELLIVDESDGTRWKIQDKTVIDLLKSYKSAPDQKTKDEIVKRLQEYVASLSKSSKISQESKESSNRCSSHEPLITKAADLSKIAENIRKLKLDENPQVLMTSTTKIQAVVLCTPMQGDTRHLISTCGSTDDEPLNEIPLKPTTGNSQWVEIDVPPHSPVSPTSLVPTSGGVTQVDGQIIGTSSSVLIGTLKMAPLPTQASQSDKQFQEPKNGGTKGDLDGNRMDVDKNLSHRPSMSRSGLLPRDNK